MGICCTPRNVFIGMIYTWSRDGQLNFTDVKTFPPLEMGQNCHLIHFPP